MTFWNDIHQLDQEITLFINSFHCGFTDAVMKFFSNIPIWIPMYAVVIIFLFIRLGWKKALIVTASLALTLLLCDQCSNLVKEAVGRIRPCNDEIMNAGGVWILERGRSFSFFSGHASNSFGFAVASLCGFRNDHRLKYRGYAAWIFFWAFMLSISRVFVGMHYFGDVLVGALIGTAFGCLTAYLARYFIKKLK